MSQHHSTTADVLSRLRDEVSINRKAAILAVLTVIVQAGAWWTYRLLEQWEFGYVPETQAADPSIGVGAVGIIVAESLLLVGFFRLWKRASDWVKRFIKAVANVVILGGGVAAAYMLGLTWVLVGVGGLVVLDKILERYDLDWITFNALALLVGIVVVARFGSLVAPAVVIPAMVLAMVWDHLAVNLSDIMGDLVEFSSSIGIPNYIIIPDGWTVDYEGVKEFVGDGLEDDARPDGLDGIIGLGDFVFPATLTVSAGVALGGLHHLAVWGAGVGAVGAAFVLTAAVEKRDGGVPALPWLNTGTILGFALGVVASGMPVLVALGVNGGA